MTERCERCRGPIDPTKRPAGSHLEFHCSEPCYKADEADCEAAEEARERAWAAAEADAEAFGPETIFDGDGRL